MQRSPVDDAERREYAEVCLAQHYSQRGEVDLATDLVSGLSSERAADLRSALSQAKPSRDALGAAVEACRMAPDVARWAAVAHAEMAAGHSIAGECTARAICRAHPDEPLAWTTLARVLHEHGRHRDALVPARKAVRLAGDDGQAVELLARILARLGVEASETTVAGQAN